MTATSRPGTELAARIAAKTCVAGVIGLGYVGLPLAVASARQGIATIGFDVDQSKIDQVEAGQSYILAVVEDDLRAQVAAGRFHATADFADLARCDVIMICVPTPLTKYREPDLQFVISTTEVIARHLRAGQLIVLESTTYPGTTEELMVPILERGGLKCGEDFFVGFSPEREDPGNHNFQTSTIPKVVGGLGETAGDVVEAFYNHVVDRTVRVSSLKAAEAVKITENVFRAVNIALVNELKVIYDAMGIDVWEVIDAAASKPFGYMPFYPGPGLGGHCIPIDPFYLTWKAREFDLATRFIELAGEINVGMPRYVVTQLERELDRRFGISLSRSRVLLLGISYKKNVPDMRESPSLVLLDLLQKRGSVVDFHDPLVPVIPWTREHPEFAGLASTPLSSDMLSDYDAILIATDHDAVDYALISEHSRLIVDTRNAMARAGCTQENVRKA